MVNIESFFRYVTPDVMGAPEPAIMTAVQGAIVEFCEKSLVLQRDHDPITAIAGLTDYELDPPDNHLAVKIMRAWFNGGELEPLAPDEVSNPAIYNRFYSGADSMGGTPRQILQKDERTFSLWPTPEKTESNAITLRVALKPRRDAEKVEDVLYEDYAEVISAGAKARLQMSTGQPYFNAQMAGANMAAFQQGLNIARSRAVHGHGRSNLRVQMRRI